MKVLLPLAALILTSSAFSAEMLRQSCSQPKDVTPLESVEAYQPWMDQYNISFATPHIQLQDLAYFKYEFGKFPSGLALEMVDAGATIRLIDGNSVTDDPTWDGQTNQKTLDGRDWNNIVGAGGSPSANFAVGEINSQLYANAQEWKSYCKKVRCSDEQKDKIFPKMATAHYATRVVVNKFYGKWGENKMVNGMIQRQYNVAHGSSNLFLHEHGHALDSIYSQNGLSKSAQWKAFMSTDASFAKLLKKINSSIPSTDTTESFAELFAYYHSCDNTRKHVEIEAPRIAAFFKGLTVIKGTALDTRKVKVEVVKPVIVPAREPVIVEQVKEVEVPEEKIDRTLFELPSDISEKALIEESLPSDTTGTVPMTIIEDRDDSAEGAPLTPEVEVGQEEKKAKRIDFDKIGDKIEDTAGKVGDTIGDTAGKVGSFFKKSFNGLRRRIGDKD